MRPTSKTRKPIAQLQIEDLETFPIWKFVDDDELDEEQDETWVRPLKGKSVPAGCYSLSVAADFVTASGSVIPGFVGVTTAKEFELGHGALLFEGQYIFVASSDASFAAATRRTVCAALGLREPEVFPLRFTLRIPIVGEAKQRTGEFK